MLLLCEVLAYVVVYIALVFVLYVSLGHDSWYYFDPKDFNPRDPAATFEPHCARYQSLSKLLITLSTASIGFLINSLTHLQVAPETPNQYSSRLAHAAPTSIVFFSFSVASGLLFILLQSYYYEQYCHSLKADSYKTWKYASSLGFGYSGLIWFVVAVGNLAWKLFR
jgi:hypothetical protein